MFLSEYHHTFDIKGRITVPADFREYLSAGMVITRGFDKNLMILTPEDFNLFVAQIREMDLTNPRNRMLQRRLLSQAQKVDLDASGRVLIQPHLREFAQINSEAVIIGLVDYIEIWTPNKWDEQINGKNQEVEHELEQVAGLTFKGKNLS